MNIHANMMFADRYELERLLGSGGFSEVWLAKDQYTQLHIAIKIYAPGKGLDGDGLKEFSAELARVFDLNSPYLLRPTHVDIWEGMPFLIMPYCANGSISKCIGKMSEEEVWKLIHDVASGLAYLHQHDIIHQDIKPDNILLDDQGNYLITDFGISAKARTTLQKSAVGGTLTAGTMSYMGPERFSKQPAPTKASDIWSLGAMIFEMLTGSLPFGEFGGSMQKAGAEIPDIDVPVSNTLRQIIEQMLSKDPWDRPTAETLSDFRPKSSRPTQKLVIEDNEKPSFASSTPTDNTKAIIRRITIVSIIILVLACVGYFLVQINNKPNPKPTPKKSTPIIVGEDTSVSVEPVREANDPEVQLVILPAEFTQTPTPTAPSIKKEIFQVNGVSFTMVYVEEDTFSMGATYDQGQGYWNNNGERYYNEEPVHIAFVNSYSIAECEVTQALWTAVTGVSMRQHFDKNVRATSYKDEGANIPMHYLNYQDCLNFIAKLNELCSEQLGNRKFVLPTEEQWEYAARGGQYSKRFKYSGSNKISEVAWYRSNSNDDLHRVKAKKCNELGLYDMSGNVWEWCSNIDRQYNAVDAYGGYAIEIQKNEHVIRGGNYCGVAKDNRIAVRRLTDSNSRFGYGSYGCRLCLVPN